MLSLAMLIDKVIDIYTWIVIAGAIMSWLVAFGVVNISNKFIRMVVEVLYRLTEPVLRPIRRILPNPWSIWRISRFLRRQFNHCPGPNRKIFDDNLLFHRTCR